MVAAMTDPRRPWTDHRRRLMFVGVVAAAVAAPSAIVMWSPWSDKTLPTITGGYSRCPAASESSIPPATAAAEPLVPDVRYLSVQLCPGTTSPTGERTAIRNISNDTSAEIVARLNALPSTPPTAECASRPHTVVDLVLKGENPPVIVHLDTGPCGSAYRNGVIRYGADDLHRYAADLLDSNDK
jgi:hypothetical protein